MTWVSNSECAWFLLCSFAVHEFWLFQRTASRQQNTSIASTVNQATGNSLGICEYDGKLVSPASGIGHPSSIEQAWYGEVQLQSFYGMNRNHLPSTTPKYRATKVRRNFPWNTFCLNAKRTNLYQSLAINPSTKTDLNLVPFQSFAVGVSHGNSMSNLLCLSYKPFLLQLFPVWNPVAGPQFGQTKFAPLSGIIVVGSAKWSWSFWEYPICIPPKTTVAPNFPNFEFSQWV